jgi:hypothetical protein
MRRGCSSIPLRVQFENIYRLLTSYSASLYLLGGIFASSMVGGWYFGSLTIRAEAKREVAERSTQSNKEIAEVKKEIAEANARADKAEAILASQNGLHRLTTVASILLLIQLSQCPN